MRKVIMSCVLLVLCFNLSAQTKKKKKEKEDKPKTEYKYLYIKDRVVLDIFSSVWLNMPRINGNKITQRVINQGVNFSLIYDFPIKKKSPFSFGVGLGVTHQTMYTNGNVYIGEGYTTQISPIPEGIEYKKNKLGFTNINIPIEFRYFHSSGFKISVGVRIGILAEAYSAYKGSDLTGINAQRDYINKKLPNKAKYPVEFTFRTGWKYFGINASYMVTKYFEKNDAPNLQMTPFSLGISISLY